MNNIENGQSAAQQVLIKEIKGWEGKYLIYNDGRVYSLISGKFLKPRITMDGYERVCLCEDGKRYEYRIHRLVAEAFLQNPNNLPQVNHKDFDRRNNNLDNLEWCTNYENSQYSLKADRLKNNNQRGADGRYKICKAYVFTNVYNGKQFTILGVHQVAKQFDCSVKNVYAILSKYANTGAYVINGIFKGLRVDSEYLKVHRLTADHGVGSSDPKYWKSSKKDCDIVNSLSKDKAVDNNAIIDDQDLTTPSE